MKILLCSYTVNNYSSIIIGLCLAFSNVLSHYFAYATRELFQQGNFACIFNRSAVQSSFRFVRLLKTYNPKKTNIGYSNTLMILHRVTAVEIGNR